MSTLEQRVEPLLVPLLKGEPRQLPLEDAALIAAWATKTAWMHLYMQKPAFGRAHSDFVTHEMLRGLMQSQLPTGNTHVWAAHHEGNSSLEIRAGEMLLSSSPDPRDPDEYTAAITTITVEKLNLVVFSAPTTRAVPPPLPSRKWHRLWPASGGLMWPTPESASDFDILMVASQHSDRYPLPPHRFLIREDLRPKPPRRY